MENKNEKEELIKYLKENGLYIAKKEDFESLASVSGRAYQDYPLWCYYNDGVYDKELVKQTLLISLYSMYDEGVIYSDSEELNSLVILLPPGFTGIKSLSFIWNGGYKVLYNYGIRKLMRMSNFESFAMNMRKNYTNNGDWYLYVLCVDKNFQGKKIASKLMKPLLNYIKLNKQICYLETHWDKNVPIYEHFGFKVLEKSVVPGSNVRHYAMLFDGNK